jgi:hypothetical protein
MKMWRDGNRPQQRAIPIDLERCTAHNVAIVTRDESRRQMLVQTCGRKMILLQQTQYLTDVLWTCSLDLRLHDYRPACADIA